MAEITIEELLVSGAHFGHLARLWNPKMRPYIFMKKNGVHVIDLKKTLAMLNTAANSIRELAENGEKILFVGTKKQAQEIIKNEAERCGMYYITERWLGGTLTNLQTVRRSIKTLKNIEKMFADGTADSLNKKERLTLDRKREKLESVLSGIKDLNRLPGALFVVDIKKEHIAIAEAKKLDIPVFAIVDTNCDPGIVDHIIPANDDAFKSIAVITKTIADAVLEGAQVHQEKVKALDMDKILKDADFPRKGKDSRGGKDAPRRRRRRRRTEEATNRTASSSPAPKKEAAKPTEAKAETKVEAPKETSKSEE